jgi:hypothetical protein
MKPWVFTALSRRLFATAALPCLLGLFAIALLMRRLWKWA